MHHADPWAGLIEHHVVKRNSTMNCRVVDLRGLILKMDNNNDSETHSSDAVANTDGSGVSEMCRRLERAGILVELPFQVVS